MIKVTFPDGKSREFAEGIKAIEIAAAISSSLAKEVVGIEINEKMVDFSFQVTTDSTASFYKFSDPKGKEVYWHSSAHIMAQAVRNLFPEVKVAIGPAIEQGFYYDFDFRPFTEEDLPKIEAEFNKIVKSGLVFERKEVSRNEAIEMFGKDNEIYKVELIEALPEDSVISTYTQGDFTDLCRGPHVGNTSKVKNFKILATSGAYWRGDVKNKMLQRIYGITFPTKDEMDWFLKRREEAEKRDHRKVGRDLDLFSFHQEAPGMPFFHNNGIIIWNELLAYWREEHKRDGYQETKTPIMMTRGLWETSGHWDHYKDNMYTTMVDDMEYAIKPMNCPGGMLLYKAGLHSYKELPIRAGEIGLVHRHEASGALSGMFRVRCFHQDDAHIFMRPDQIKDEIFGVLKLADRMYSTFGLEYSIELSTRPTEGSIGTDEAWEMATNGLKSALDEYGMPYKINPGDGAFYGPKIDIKVLDALNRRWQCATIQLDMNLPERFDLSYIDENSNKLRPIMIHRVIYGSLERFMGVITEHFGGFFPLWLAPVQVAVIPVSERFQEFARTIADQLESVGLRVYYDDRSEKVGYKIREADGVKKVPYMLVIGEKELESNIFSVRQHIKGDVGTMSLDALIEQLKSEIKTKKLPDGYKPEL